MTLATDICWFQIGVVFCLRLLLYLMSDIGVVLLLLKDHPPGLCALPRDQAGVDGKLKWKVGF